jgi:hypothetical protein
MSKTKALAYIDTIMGYLNPRIVECLNLATGINELNEAEKLITIAPNPASSEFTIDMSQLNGLVEYIEIYDLNGRLVYNDAAITSDKVIIQRDGLADGLYNIQIRLENGIVNKKLVLQ